MSRSGGGLFHLDREIHFDPIVPAVGCEQAAAGMKARLFAGLEVARCSEDMSAGKGGVPTEINFDGWRKPAQVETIRLAREKCIRGEIHRPRNALHRRVVLRL